MDTVTFWFLITLTALAAFEAIGGWFTLKVTLLNREIDLVKTAVAVIGSLVLINL